MKHQSIMYLIRLCVMLSSLDAVAAVKYCSKVNDIIDKYEVETFAMVGVNMCNLKCSVRGYCWSIGYDGVFLMCHVLKLRLDHREECGQLTFIPKANKTKQGALCTSETCRDRRCLEARSGRDACVKGMGDLKCEEGMSLGNTLTAHSPEPNGKNDEQRYIMRLNTKLVGACMDGDMNRIQCILSDGRVEINVRGPQRKTPVMIAAEKAFRQVFNILVRTGADLSLEDDESNTILHFACMGGNLDIIKFLLIQNTMDINIRGGQGRTPVMTAALKGSKDVFDLLVSKGADLSLVDLNSNTILHLACEGGNLGIVKHILSQNTVNINSLGGDDWTPAMKAAIKGHKDVFNLMVKKGADLSLVDEEGYSILHAACEGGNVEIVNYILTQGSVDINLEGKNMFTPVLMAAYAGHEDVFNLLVRENADVLMKDSDHNNILHLACKGGNMEIIKYILANYRFDVNDIGGEGLTSIMLAASKGRKDTFDLLLQNGADLSHEDDNRNNILHMACEGGNLELIKYVLTQSSVEINGRSDDGWTSAMRAAHKGHTNVLKLLVSEGVELTQGNSEKRNILHAAIGGKRIDTVKYVLKNDFVKIDSRNIEGMTAVMMAVAEGLAEICHLLVRKGANLSLVNDQGRNTLHVACDGGHSEIVKYILTENVVNINDREDKGMTPVILAAQQGYRDIVVLLVSKGADLLVVDDDGESILHKLSMTGHVELMKFVLTLKNVVQDINKKANGGRTPLMIAAYRGHKEVFDLLVKKGADLTLVDMHMNTILHGASEGGNVDIVKHILEKKIVDISAKNVDGLNASMVARRELHHAVYKLLLSQRVK